MLKWFVDAEVAAGAIEHPRKLIEEENVEGLPDAVLDENVDANLITKFFTHNRTQCMSANTVIMI